jgi:quercetin dioxygenase-like cupin family protein
VSEAILVEDLDNAIEGYKERGYRLDMIFPADNPREAVVSKEGKSISLHIENHPGLRPPLLRKEGSRVDPSPGAWIRGRAGMEYRDLIPDRMGGQVIASHIRLTDGGEVPDYVHYHKIDFQVIYCLKGRIKVVYEDQGDPFWLEAGDLVLQPSQIRHRVLECAAGSEVIEITRPAEHETWVEHDLDLPTGQTDTDRSFGGRRFFRHIAGQSDARDEYEAGLVRLAETLSEAASDEARHGVVTTFSRSLCQM